MASLGDKSSTDICVARDLEKLLAMEDICNVLGVHVNLR